MSVSNFELIKQIFDECDFVATHTNGKDSNQVINDKVLVRALERSIEIIGEAANKIEMNLKKITLT
jgi:uncharacterized protein with HEPN domain